jgi:hypothetical protein
MRVEQAALLNLSRVVIERRSGAKGYQAHRADTTALQKAVLVFEEPLEMSCLKGQSALSELAALVWEERLSRTKFWHKRG